MLVHQTENVKSNAITSTVVLLCVSAKSMFTLYIPPALLSLKWGEHI